MAPHILLLNAYSYKPLLLFVAVFFAGAANAFVVAPPQTSRQQSRRTPSSATTWSRHEMLRDGVGVEGSEVFNRWISLDDFHQVSSTTPTRSFGGTSISSSSNHFWLAATDTASILDALGEGLRTVAIGVTVVIFFFAGLAYLTAAILIPKAAEQLEIEAKELAPDLWQEYQAKLGPGESMATRPDLLQELGNKIKPLIERKMMREQQQQQQGRGGGGGGGVVDASSSQQVMEIDAVTSSSSRPTKSAILDAEVIEGENMDTKKTT
jgi:hypothetical protein